MSSRCSLLRHFRQLLTTFLLVIACSSGLHAEPPLPQEERLQSSPVLQHLKPNPVDLPDSPTAAQQTLSRMHVPEGFSVNLIAAEPRVHQPIAFAWDELGRLWVAEAYSYPAKRPEGEGLDKIVIFADEDGDGQFENRKVFAEGLNLVSGLEIGYGGVWVGAAPELLFIPDRNRDDQPDGPPEVLLNGFGFQDTHETLNSFLWGPDGWLYGIQGVFNTARIGTPETPIEDRPELRAGVWRFHPVKRQFEIFAHGGSNPWGLDYDENGELFMTHCRSYWGRGFTTHVVQGGHYWNQVNGNHAPFIIGHPPQGFPGFRNFLLASARYGHGAGGAGPRGSDAIYGGHSHVGTMIYLGDNWPEKYRGHLFTHNLGGHQINHEINRPDGSGYETVSAGSDMLFCTDPAYVAVDLQYGPDGAVYIIDWVDPQHCHNPNTEQWDRSNGRIYRMQWDESFQPVQVDLRSKTGTELVALLKHENQWFARTARRLLHERALSDQGVEQAAVDNLTALLANDPYTANRLNALWALHLVDELTHDRQMRALLDEDPHVRGWAVQLAAEDGSIDDSIRNKLLAMAEDDSSPVTRRYLISAMQRVPTPAAWRLGEKLAAAIGNSNDPNLPFLLWQSMAPLMSQDIDRAFRLAQSTRMPQLADWIHWYAATMEGKPLNRAVASLDQLSGDALHKHLAGLWLAVEPRANIPEPAAWPSVSPALYAHENNEVKRLAENVASVFGDDSIFPRLRRTLANQNASTEARKHAFSVLSRAQDAASLDVFLQLLREPVFRSQAIGTVARFDRLQVADSLIRLFPTFDQSQQSAALNALTSRAGFALKLMDAVEQGAIPRDQITAFHVRQMNSLNHPKVNERVAGTWGRIQQTPAEMKSRIDALETTYNEAPLWAYSENQGRNHFALLCAPCHKLNDVGTSIGPDLTGAGKHGVRYYLENIIDPNAVIGTDYQLTTVETKDGDLISGVLRNENATAITLQTTTEERVIPKASILQRETGNQSLMPEGLLEALNERQQIELLKYLVTN